jgi:uncharacterized protein YjiS (DUF1127 family)
MQNFDLLRELGKIRQHQLRSAMDPLELLCEYHEYRRARIR